MGPSPGNQWPESGGLAMEDLPELSDQEGGVPDSGSFPAERDADSTDRRPGEEVDPLEKDSRRKSRK